MKKNGLPRMLPSRWSHSEHKTFVEMLKTEGKVWSRIAAAIGTKNEQQCRTRGLILANKLMRNCWDQDLLYVLAPHGKFSCKDAMRASLKNEIKSENIEGGDSAAGKASAFGNSSTATAL